MNKKTLAVIAAISLMSGVAVNDAQALTQKYYNSAIINTLPLDSNRELQTLYKVITNNPSDYQTHYKILKYYEDRLNFVEMEAEYTELMNLAMTSEDAFKFLEDKLTENIVLYPGQANNYWRLGTLYYKKGNSEKALPLLKEAFSLDKSNLDCQETLAKIFAEQKMYKTAITLYQGLIKVNPKNANYRMAIAECYTRTNEFEKAIQEYRIAANFCPENKDLPVVIADLAPYSQHKNIRMQYAFDGIDRPKKPNADKIAYGDDGYYYNGSTAQMSAYDTAQRTGSEKRVVVSEINGRRVMSIVNINKDNTSRVSDAVAQGTFEKQLSGTGSAEGYYGDNPQDISVTRSYNQSEPETYNVKDSQPATQPQTLKAYYGEDKHDSRDRTVRVENISPNKRLVVTYENGKKVVKIIRTQEDSVMNVQNGTYARSEVPVSSQTQTASVTSTTPTISNYQITKTQQTQPAATKTVMKTTQPSATANVQSSNNTDDYIKAGEFVTLQQYDKAIEVLKNINPPTLRSLTSIASCYNAIGDTDSAINYYNEADRLSPNNSQILYSLGYLYYVKNDTTRARDYITRSLKIDPENANSKELYSYLTNQDTNVLMNQAVTFMNNGNYKDAEGLLNKILQADPNSFQTFYYLGHINYATGNYQKAVDNFLISEKNNPSYALSYYSCGLAYDKLKDYKKSLDSYTKFLQMMTDDNKYTQYAKTRVAALKSMVK